MVNGAKIRQLREEKNMSVDSLAKEAGIGHAMMTYIEQGKRQPSLDVLERLADFFGLKLDDFITSSA